MIVVIKMTRSFAVLTGAVLVLAATGCAADNTAPAQVTVTETVRETISPTESTDSRVDVSQRDRPQEQTQITRPPVTEVDPEAFLSDWGSYYFTSPSGNLYCGILRDGTQLLAGCQAQSIVQNLPECDDPMVLRGPMISLIEDGSVATGCTNEGVYVGDEAVVLNYGEQLTVADVSCTSREKGVTCEDLKTGVRFVASRASFEQIF